MATQDKKLELLLGLSSHAERRTRADAIARVLRTAILLVDADAASVVLPSTRRKGERLVLYAGSDIPASLPIAFEKSEALRHLATEHQPLSVPDLSDTAPYDTTDACPGVEAGPVLFAPVGPWEPVPAYLAVYRKRGRARYTANETELMLLLAAWLGVSLDNLRFSANGERLEAGDDRAETYNARSLKTALRREVRRASRYGHELSVVRIEFDGTQDSGEEPGNGPDVSLVRKLSAVLSEQIRSFDVLGRHGGGLMVVLPQTGLSGAMDLAGRMRAAVESYAFAPLPAGQVTATFGVACFPQDGPEVDALVAIADRALEMGRRRGGNCVSTTKLKAA